MKNENNETIEMIKDEIDLSKWNEVNYEIDES